MHLHVDVFVSHPINTEQKDKEQRSEKAMKDVEKLWRNYPKLRKKKEVCVQVAPSLLGREKQPA